MSREKFIRAIGWIVLFIFVVGITVLLGSCGSDSPPETGKVINRKYTPAHWQGGYETYYSYEYRCKHDFEGNFVCGIEDVPRSRYVEKYRFKEDRWQLLLRSCEKKEDKCDEGWREVTQNEYERHKISDWYPKVEE